jgi:hypothetical protein
METKIEEEDQSKIGSIVVEPNKPEQQEHQQEEQQDSEDVSFYEFIAERQVHNF